MRTCVACRTSRPKGELLRVVRTPGGTVVLDVTGRLAGRGAYLCADAACVDAATKKRALDRALEVTVPPELLVGLPVTPDEHPMTSGGTRGQE